MILHGKEDMDVNLKDFTPALIRYEDEHDKMYEEILHRIDVTKKRRSLRETGGMWLGSERSVKRFIHTGIAIKDITKEQLENLKEFKMASDPHDQAVIERLVKRCTISDAVREESKALLKTLRFFKLTPFDELLAWLRRKYDIPRYDKRGRLLKPPEVSELIKLYERDWSIHNKKIDSIIAKMNASNETNMNKNPKIKASRKAKQQRRAHRREDHNKEMHSTNGNISYVQFYSNHLVIMTNFWQLLHYYETYIKVFRVILPPGQMIDHLIADGRDVPSHLSWYSEAADKFLFEQKSVTNHFPRIRQLDHINLIYAPPGSGKSTWIRRHMKDLYDSQFTIVDTDGFETHDWEVAKQKLDEILEVHASPLYLTAEKWNKIMHMLNGNLAASVGTQLVMAGGTALGSAAMQVLEDNLSGLNGSAIANGVASVTRRLSDAGDKLKDMGDILLNDATSALRTKILHDRVANGFPIDANSDEQMEITRDTCPDQGKIITVLIKRSKKGKEWVVCPKCGLKVKSYDKKTHKGYHPVFKRWQRKPAGDNSETNSSSGSIPIKERAKSTSIIEKREEELSDRQRASVGDALDGHHLNSREAEWMIMSAVTGNYEPMWVMRILFFIVHVTFNFIFKKQYGQLNRSFTTSDEENDRRLVSNRLVVVVEQRMLIEDIERVGLVLRNRWMASILRYGTYASITATLVNVLTWYFFAWFFVAAWLVFVFPFTPLLFIVIMCLCTLDIRKQTFRYVPHLVSCALTEYSHNATVQEIELSIHQKFMRLACLPIPDAEALELIRGSIYAAMAVQACKDSFFDM